MEQLIYTSILVVLIIIWMIINKKNMNKQILDAFEEVSSEKEIQSNISMRSFYYYCEKHKINYELEDQKLLVTYKRKQIICSQDGDFKMGRTVVHINNNSKKNT